MEMKTYKASYDKGAKWMTGMYVLCFLLLTGFSLSGIKGTAGLGIAAGVILLIGLITLCYSIKGYQINPDGIIVKRFAGNKLIERQNITELRVLHATDLQGTMRTMGVGGLFGYYGSFNNNKFGDMIWYMTNRQHLIGVFLKDGKPVIISPDDADGFYKDWVVSST